jgi:hypothetical protein
VRPSHPGFSSSSLIRRELLAQESCDVAERTAFGIKIVQQFPQNFLVLSDFIPQSEKNLLVGLPAGDAKEI